MANKQERVIELLVQAARNNPDKLPVINANLRKLFQPPSEVTFISEDGLIDPDIFSIELINKFQEQPEQVVALVLKNMFANPALIMGYAALSAGPQPEPITAIATNQADNTTLSGSELPLSTHSQPPKAKQLLADEPTLRITQERKPVLSEYLSSIVFNYKENILNLAISGHNPKLMELTLAYNLASASRPKNTTPSPTKQDQSKGLHFIANSNLAADNPKKYQTSLRSDISRDFLLLLEGPELQLQLSLKDKSGKIVASLTHSFHSSQQYQDQELITQTP